MKVSSERIFLDILQIPHTVFDIKIDVDLLQSDTHAGTPDVRKHDKLDVCRRFVVVKLVLASPIGDEAKAGVYLLALHCSCRTGGSRAYLSSSPPNFRVMFLREKTVPKMSLASSSVVRDDGPTTGGTPLLEASSEVGREDLLDIEGGRGSQRRL